MPDVSVIIPCYNQGHYLRDSIESVLQQSLQELEIIVVDDGSNDQTTCRILKELNYPKTRLIRKINGGLAAARNSGIKEATGRYILPLDCDDRIAPDYLSNAVTYLERKPECGIVYCQAEKFGSESGPWLLPRFSRWRMCLGNLIFCSALYRRSDWETVGGYDESLRRGWEDWDFWLGILELGRSVHCLPQVGFYYRKHEKSMATSMEAALKASLHRRLMEKHPVFFGMFRKTPQSILELYYRTASGSVYRSIKQKVGR